MRLAAHLTFMLAICSTAYTQTQLRGYVFASRSTLSPAGNAIVYLASGTHTNTSQLGFFNIPFPWPDSLHVYYQGNKLTIFITDAMLSAGRLNIYMDDTTHYRLSKGELAPVFVKSKMYKDLVEQHRQDYSDALNYHAPPVSMGNNKWHDSVAPLGGKVAIDTKNKKLSLLNVTSATHALGTKTGKQKKRLQQRLIADEHALYVQNVFTPALVKKYSTMRSEDSLHTFVTTCAPSFDSLALMTELDLAVYITRKIKDFRRR